MRTFYRFFLPAVLVITLGSVGLNNMVHASEPTPTPTPTPAPDFRDRYREPAANIFNIYQGPLVAATLASEALCQERASFCKKKLSALDLTSCATDFITTEQTQQMLSGKLTNQEKKESVNSVEKSLQCFLSQGACLEDLAPTHPLHSLYSCFLRKGSTVGTCPPVEELYKIYQKYTNNGINTDCVECRAKQQGQMVEEIDTVYKTLIGLAPSLRFDEQELKKTITLGLSWEEFVRRVLVPQKCIDKREKTANITGVFTEHYPLTTPEGEQKTAARIVKRLEEKQRGVALGLCINPESGKLEGKPGECSNFHFVIANAIRNNTKTGRLQVNIQSDWGVGSKLQQWQDLEDIAAHTFVLHQLE